MVIRRVHVNHLFPLFLVNFRLLCGFSAASHQAPRNRALAELFDAGQHSVDRDVERHVFL